MKPPIFSLPSLASEVPSVSFTVHSFASSPHPSPHQSQPHHTQYGVRWAREAPPDLGIFGESGNTRGAVGIFLSCQAKNKQFKDSPVKKLDDARDAAVSLMGTARASEGTLGCLNLPSLPWIPLSLLKRSCKAC